jgi:hypothetical protein
MLGTVCEEIQVYFIFANIINHHKSSTFNWNGSKQLRLSIGLPGRLSSCISVLPTGLIYIKFDTGGFYENLAIKEFKIWWKLEKNIGHFRLRHKHILLLLVCSLSETVPGS